LTTWPYCNQDTPPSATHVPVNHLHPKSSSRYNTGMKRNVLKQYRATDAHRLIAIANKRAMMLDISIHTRQWRSQDLWLGVLISQLPMVIDLFPIVLQLKLVLRPIYLIYSCLLKTFHIFRPIKSPILEPQYILPLRPCYHGQLQSLLIFQLCTKFGAEIVDRRSNYYPETKFKMADAVILNLFSMSTFDKLPTFHYSSHPQYTEFHANNSTHDWITPKYGPDRVTHPTSNFWIRPWLGVVLV